MRSLALALAVALAGPDAAPAQSTLFPLGEPVVPQSSVLVLDQDRLFLGSRYGQRVTADIDRAGAALDAENRRLADALLAEERALTERRPTLEPEEFRRLADAFDDKVGRTRSEFDAKVRALGQRADAERDAFLNRVLPTLSRIVSERGATVILDKRQVFLSADAIDITEAAIARIDAELGDGSDMPPVPVPNVNPPELVVPDRALPEGDGATE